MRTSLNEPSNSLTQAKPQQMQFFKAFDFIYPDNESNYVAIDEDQTIILHLPAELQDTWENVDTDFILGFGLLDQTKQLEKNQKNIMGIQFADQMRSSKTISQGQKSKRPLFGVSDKARHNFVTDKSKRVHGAKVSHHTPNSSRSSSMDRTKGEVKGMLTMPLLEEEKKQEANKDFHLSEDDEGKGKSSTKQVKFSRATG